MSETGADYGQDYVGTFQDENEDKNHNRMADPEANLAACQPGMIVSDNETNKLKHCTAANPGGTFLEILQGKILCGDNKVLCGDNKVLFTPYI